MKKIQMIAQLKLSDGKWHDNCVFTDEAEIYRRLSENLIAKKINKCLYIKSISRRQNYDGTHDITVTFVNGVRHIYTIPTH